MSTITLQNVSYLYSAGTPFEKYALKDINVTIPSGRITGLIGHTGSGKSTLVQLLNGLLRPTEGKILLDGRDIWEDEKKIRDVRFKVGLVMQYPEYQLFEETVRKDIAFGPKNMGLEAPEIEERVKMAAFFCGITEDLLDKSPFELSGGQKRRVAIAGVIAMRPEFLILDEPSAGLDPVGRDTILGGIKKYREETGGSVVIVSHSMEDVAVYCDSLIVMNKGAVYAEGDTREIFLTPEKLYGVGLDVPQITGVTEALRSKGLELPPDILTVSEARDAILSLAKRRGLL